MDGYIDHLFSSSPWSDGDVKERSCWGYSETVQPNVLIPTSLRPDENDREISPLSMMSSEQNEECLPTQDTSSLALNSDSDYAGDKSLISAQAQLQKEGQNCIDSLKMENMGLQYDTGPPALSSLSLSCSKQLPMLGSLTSSPSFNEVDHAGLNGIQEFEYQRSFKAVQNLSSMPQLWPSASYDGFSSVSAAMGQETTQQINHQEGNLGDGMDFTGKKYVSMDQILQLHKLSATVASKDEENFQSYPNTCFTAGSNMTLPTNRVSLLSQSTSTAPAGKPRVRARRGQATDPHSIAERLRREKIAERMKNLQELVPNSSKVDKASMLDEIIEYVKFLQLQVKVLSMSRLGAAGAVIPLITDGQAEGSNSLSLSPSAGLGIDVAQSPEQIAFEQEVLKLMESNVTTAIQYLQGKGLCLMPIALAAAISHGKESLSCNGSEEKKISFNNDLVHSNNRGSCSRSSSSSSSCSFSGIETCQMSYDCNIMPEQLCSKSIVANSCNGILKMEDVKNQFSREMKPKAIS